MRSKRAILAGVGLLLALPSVVRAQDGRDFQDSWFWGVKAGGLAYGANGNFTQAPLVGLDWLITRSEAGLYVSVSQAFLSQQTAIVNGPAATDTGSRLVDIKDMRRIDLALMAFPGSSPVFHPYVGVGFSLNDVASASAEGPYTTQDQIDFADETVQNLKAAFTPLLIAGGQYKFTNFSAFGQVTIASTNRSFLLYGGRAESFTYEFGVRYNFGSSISSDSKNPR